VNSGHGNESKPSGRKNALRSGSINQEKYDESVIQANEELKIQMKTLELRIKDLEAEAEKNSKEKQRSNWKASKRTKGKPLFFRIVDYVLPNTQIALTPRCRNLGRNLDSFFEEEI